MRQVGKSKKITPAKELACVAVTCALLTGSQYVFSFVVGVEIVTLVSACFAFCLGIRRGVFLAVAFSLLRCIAFGFSPTAVILYLLYYPLLAAVFGGLGRIKREAYESFPARLAVAVNVLLIGIAAACAVLYGFDLIKTSRIYKYTLYALLWVIFALCIGLCIVFDGLLVAKKIYGKNSAEALGIITLTAVGAACTVVFTLLDDVITPLVCGYSRGAAVAYFYASFTAMLPQVICTVVTLSTLFMPLAHVFERSASLR